MAQPGFGKAKMQCSQGAGPVRRSVVVQAKRPALPRSDEEAKRDASPTSLIPHPLRLRLCNLRLASYLRFGQSATPDRARARSKLRCIHSRTII
jgi:hypothetical protein